MNIYIALPNDKEFEFEADILFHAGNDYTPVEVDSAEFENYGPFYDMFDAVYTACWYHNCSMTIEDMLTLAGNVEIMSITKFLESPPEYDPTS